MGVFAMFRRKKKDVVAASPESEEAGTVASAEDGDAESGPGVPEAAVASEAAEAEGTTGAGATTGVAEVAESADGAEDTERVGADEADGAVAGSAATASVEIPKQQSAEAAADNEAGDHARR
ncbi:hypothetical protein [Streptomyces sp. NPDC058664]|uniref:hypothetical protein n=1 Tax=unclassified Streptomyces TaxID=2593676 RepID=UPI00365C511A